MERARETRNFPVRLSTSRVADGGTGSFASNAKTSLSGSLTIAPGKYFLVQIGPTGTVGGELPVTVDFTGSTSTTPSGTAGKVILVSSQTGLNCNGSSASPCSHA